jgi:hypothetical protein
MQTIKLIGLQFDCENLTDATGNELFTHRQAIKLANEFGKRLMTEEESKKLSALPHAWDDEQKGIWFSENKEDLKTEKSLFLPALGNRRLSDEKVVNQSGYGLYWTGTIGNHDNGKYLCFSSLRIYQNDACNQSFGFCVRCVQAE